MSKRCTVSDGKVALNLDKAEQSEYIVSSPFILEPIPQAETIGEAFAGARDAAMSLRVSQAKLMMR
jgi:hypothetical protein